MALAILASFPAPTVNPDAHAQVSERPIQIVSEKPLIDCAKYTGKHVEGLIGAFKLFAPIPRYQGNNMAAAGIAAGFTALFVLVRPLLFTLIVGIELPQAAAGTVGTVAIGSGFTIGWLIQTAINSVRSLIPNPGKLREHLTQQFINRMKAMVAELPPEKRDYFLQNPEQLINIAVLCVAFLSRYEEEGLKVGERDVLKLEHLNRFDETRKQYFRDVCGIKESIRGLNLNFLDEPTAWGRLMEMFSQCQFAPHVITEDGWEVISSKKDFYKQAQEQAPHVNQNVIKILVETFDLSGRVANDEVFRRLWAKERML
jgi:hypothetical protein